MRNVEFTQTPIGIFATRINGMMRDYDISFVTACEWDALGFMPGHPMNTVVNREQIYSHYLDVNLIVGTSKKAFMDMIMHRKADVFYKQINKQ